MKRKINAAAIAVAVILAVSGCSKVEDIQFETTPSFETVSENTENEETLPSETSADLIINETETSSESRDTESEASEELPEETSDEEITEQSESELFAMTEEVTRAAETTAVPTLEAQTESTTAETTAASWFETNRSGEMLVNTDCYAYDGALPGSTPIQRYSSGSRVSIAAITDTGYYRLVNGDYIRTDNLINIPPEVSTAATRATTAATTKPGESQTEKTSRRITQTQKTTMGMESGTADSNSIYSGPETSYQTSETGNYLPQENTRIQPTLYSKDYHEKYAYKQLTSDEQKLYGDLVTAVKNLNTFVSTPDGMTYDSKYRVYLTVYNQEPQLFWMGSSFSVTELGLTITYKETSESKIKSMQSDIEANANTVLAKANGTSDTFEKLKIMYDYIILNNQFCLSSEGYNATIYNAFTHNGDLQCAGYAKSIQYLCDIAGIDSTVVVGTNDKGESHAWNVVYCIDGYYNLDATWGDPIQDTNPKYIKYNYFLVPDSWIKDNSHYNINKFMNGSSSVYCFAPPSCTHDTYNYYVHKGLVFSDFDAADAALKKGFEEAVANGSSTVEIKVTDAALFDKLVGNAGTYQKYAKKLSTKVSKISKHSQDVYKKNGIVFFDIVYA